MHLQRWIRGNKALVSTCFRDAINMPKTCGIHDAPNVVKDIRLDSNKCRLVVVIPGQDYSALAHVQKLALFNGDLGERSQQFRFEFCETSTKLQNKCIT